MTLNELKENIAASPNREWLQSYELKINYQNINYSTTLLGVVNIYSFIIDQSDGFSKLSPLPKELEEVRMKFINAKGSLLQLISQNNIAKATWDSNLRFISNTNNQPVFLYNTTEVDFLIKVYRERPEYYNGAYEYFTGSTQHANNKAYLTGYLLAYEFDSKDFSSIAERKEAEKKSILSIRSGFQEKLGNAEKEVVEYIAKSNQKFEEYASKIDSFKTEKETTYNDWFQRNSVDFTKFHTASVKQIADLEVLYKEKLKLEAPAKYWNERAKKLRTEGYWWLGGLILSVAISVGILIWVLNKVADGTFQDIFKETGSAVKWSVALITLISFLAYIIRVLSKLTFSSFHLVRDAEEREQLTYVYLALQKENKIDPTERHLVMQSLFSRADSGLLKDDASPTMPGNIVDQFTKK
ncbi:MAG: DUF6161 domain-containing protein [Ignavibacteriaceae bacterium]